MTSATNLTDPAVHDAVLRVRSALGFARLEDVAVLEATGPDAERFLQNRLSNDVAALQPGQGQMNAVLDRHGKIQGVFTLFKQDPGFRLLLDRAERENAAAQILKFRILEQVSLDELPGAKVFSLQGPKAAEALQGLTGGASLPERELGWKTLPLFDIPAWVARLSHTGEHGFTIVVDDRAPENFWEKLRQVVLDAGGVEMTPPVLEVLRVEAGIPRYGKDYDFETLLPETGLERQAVSYSKGCYLGQETIARVKTYGMVQQALVGLLFEPDETPPPAQSECRVEGKSIGKITSVVISPTLGRPLGMAYLGKTERIPGRKLPLEIGGQFYEATVTLLPFHDARLRDQSGKELLDEGLKLFSEGYDEEAIRKLRRAIEIQPDLVEAYEALGVILSRQEAYDEAIALMNRVLALDPDHVLAHTNLSVYYMKKGDKEKAEEEKALATTAAFKKKMQESGMTFDPLAHELEERRKKEQAALEKIAMFTEALKFNPSDPLGNFGLGSCYLDLKRYDEAIEPFEKTIAAQPKHSAAYLALGKSYEGSGNPGKAQETYEKGIEVAAARGDLMPLQEMQARLDNLRRG